MHKPEDFEVRLAEIHTRLGDLKRYEGATLDAIEEYTVALRSREAHCPAHDRSLSDSHFSLAVAYVYLSVEPNQNVLDCKRVALKHDSQAKEVLELWLARRLPLAALSRRLR
jgi:hypothetical protein